MINVAINGYGRIGRNILRAYYERPNLRKLIRLVAINDLLPIEMSAHLTMFDTTHGRFPGEVTTDEGHIIIGSERLPVFAERDPTNLPWAALSVDIVLECTGFFTDRISAEAHLKAGAKKVLVSAPGAGMDATIVYGVNHHLLRDSDLIVSNASCTTNCLAPLVKQIHESFGIENGLMTTIHAYTNDQNISDAVHSDPYRARAAAQSMIPTKTGAASAIGLVLPELKGRLDGLAVRVPTLNVSLVDLTLHLTTATTVEEINKVMKKAAEHDSLGVFACTEKPLVSIDFNHNSFSSNFDSNHTRVNGNLVKVLSWYDNEWGFSNRMLDTALVMAMTSQSKQVGVAA